MGPFSNPLKLFQRPFSNGSVSSGEQHQRFNRIRQRRQNNVLRKRCSLRLVADYSFYSKYARSRASGAIQIMVNSIEEVNRIYQHTPWAIPDNLGWGFVIKQVLVHTEYSNGPINGPFSYNYKVDHWNTSDKLEAFSRHRDIMQFCLAHLFTSTLFMNSRFTVGLAFVGSLPRVGGICSRDLGDSYPRTSWTTTLYGPGYRILGIQHKMITAHEFGHNWGSSHDPQGPCAPSDDQGGRYIMFPSVLPGTHPNNLRFSQCSIDSISEILKFVSQNCFTDNAEDEVPCGNGVVDIREECDAGAEGLEGKDHCCSSICLLRTNASCSDFNSQCCRNCSLAPAGTECKANADNQCLESAMCDGVSTDCPSALPKENGTVCHEEGQCINGRCITKYCKEYGKVDNRLYTACMCDRNAIDACKHCCMEIRGYKNYGPCFPTVTSLGFGEPCFKGVCNEQGECKSEKDVLCGNGVLDEREECDVGENGVKNQDKCCNRTCKLRESAQCSDFNKACCRDCKIAPTGTVCEDNFELPCMEIAECDGVFTDCPSALPKENGTVCRGEGQCINGRCITKYCKELGEKDNRLYKACMCDHDASAACKRCCMEVFDYGINGPCFPTNETLRYGQRCYNGECNEKGLCIPSEGTFTVRLIDYFNNWNFNTLAETIKTNIVMTIVVLTALFWIPISFWISFLDRKNKKPVLKKPMKLPMILPESSASKEPPKVKPSTSVDPKIYEMRNMNPTGSSVD